LLRQSRIRLKAVTTAVFACAALLSGSEATGKRDPEFSKLPFSEWVAQGERNGLAGWSVEILPAELSTHQRLMLRIVIRVEGRVLEKHRAASRFVTMVQYTDRDGVLWQHHTSLDLATLPAGNQARQLAIAQYAFVLRGDYALAIAVCDAATLEHSLVFREVHVEGLKNDPLPGASIALPAVEFIPAVTEPPDVWYLPGIEHRLNLSLETRRPVDIQVLVNTTPSTRPGGSIGAMRGNMTAVIPAMKVLSQIDVRNGRIDVAFLDLVRRRVSFGQDWDGVRKILLDATPGLIDVRDLGGQAKMRQFFREEVIRRLVAGGSAIPVVIVLSGPAFLQDQEPLGLVDARDPDGRLFYIRFGKSSTAQPLAIDDLERAVDGLNAQVYEATSEEEFRGILADVLARISRL
jgi:hypothetical protein